MAFRAISIRACLYIVVLIGLMQGIFLIDAQRAGGPDFSEVSLTEFAQAALLFACSAMMLYVRHRLRTLPTVGLLLWGFFAASFVRENDAWLDRFIFDGAWQLLVVVIVLPTLFIVIRRRHRFLSEFRQMANTLGFGLFASGFLITYVFSRLYGRSVFWQALMGDQYLYVVKSAAEEVTELAGYSLLLFACIEIVLLAKRLRHGQRG